MRRSRAAFTIVEIVVVMILTGMALVILYEIYHGLSYRAVAVQKRAEGQQAVRILLVRLRHELKRATSCVQIEKSNQLLRIPLTDPKYKIGEEGRDYFMEYEFLPDRKEIVLRKLNRDKKAIEERLWMGGQSQILKFKCYDTGENERILFQYYRVILELDHYEVKMREVVQNPGRQEEEKKEVVHLTTTVYPRRVNMELRIEVPQEGATVM